MTRDAVTFQDALIKGSAGRHETFTPRYGWLKKGFDRCLANPHVFNDDNAIEQLGVGKNMVRSIRFWCILFRLLEYDEKPGCLRPSDFGKKLLDTENGWDPYLEDPASLWLLHWQIFRAPFMAVSWNLAFSYIMLQTFTGRELTNAIDAKAREIEGLCNIAKSSFEKDVSCILRMYLPDNREQVEIRCPFTDLGLIVPAIESPEKDRYRYSSGSKPNLPDLVFMAAVFDYASQWYPGQNSLPLSHITFGPMSPGMAFRLSESECGQRIESVCRQIHGVTFTETNGIRQVQFVRTPVELNKECLVKYYGGKR
ncbi:MAG: DUF4007 family protein [Syntrophaceae bacterium]